ncbi:M48 family metallopeptidase [Gloeocapsa sp. PCC 73106]|uniref:M48 family metallopeptidase n=1 Tax=Gloeocapsa sp. PCC 73106 TaxID=102232 RepID=UPI0002AD0D0B|nr:M48 family metallopeptidase [Gloeocapsa sp. PCC 73106]ELR99431.1 Zn-dependent protease with chaperone function [Gloeocapsa sp. PCC 73106]
MPSYPGIASQAFKHPEDQQAEDALRSLPGFDLVASSFIEYLQERPQQIYLLGNNIKVGPRQYATVYGIFRDCLRDLSIYPKPDLYIAQNPQVNAYSLGHQHPYIVLNTGLLELMNETELRVAIAHELGHIKCEHTILIQMAIWVMGAASLLGELTLGLGNLISSSLIFAFYEWRRKAELSADRATLLLMGDLEPVFQTMMTLAGGTQKYQHECSLAEFIRQAEQYQDLGQDNLNQVYRFFVYNGSQGNFLTHPFAVERLLLLKDWSTSAQYQQIRQGNYPREGAKGAVNVESQSEAEILRRQIQDLQEQIDRLRSQRK